MKKLFDNKIAKGLVSFNTPIPIYIKVKNSRQQNGLLVVEGDGAIRFENNQKLNQENEKTRK